MEAKQSTGKYWALCFFWLAIMITLLVVYHEFFWLALPGTVTYFAKAMDIILDIGLDPAKFASDFNIYDVGVRTWL
ncbi:hypothetical protein ACEV76_24690, partial [Vibrio parahaemolyticus]